MAAGPDDDELHRLIGELFDVPAAEQQEWLLRRVPHDAALRARLAEVVAPMSESRPVRSPGFGLQLPTADIPIPERIGRYEVVRLLGSGGMGHVFLAHDPAMQREVAIKVLAGQSGTDFRLRFVREARAAGGLTHRNLVTVHDVGEADGVPFIVMEFVSGHTLQQVIAAPSPPPLDQRLEILDQVCSGLDCAHRAGIVHRDVKPGNVMVDRSGIVKLLDFGISKPLREASALTTSPVVIGTSGYMSPEQAAAGQVDARSDIYSTAVLALELLTLRKPFAGQEAHLPDAVAQVVAKGMAALPQNRFQTIAEMQRALGQARLVVRDATAAPLLRGLEATTSQSPGRSALAWGVTAALSVLLMSGLWFAMRRPSPEGMAADSTAPSTAQLQSQTAVAISPTPTPPAPARSPSDATVRERPAPVTRGTTSPLGDGREARPEVVTSPIPRAGEDTPIAPDAVAPAQPREPADTSAADAARPDVPATTAPDTTSPWPTAASAPPVVAPTEAIARALSAFEQAFASLSTPALRRSYPGLARSELAVWERVFLDSASYDLRLSNRRIQLLSPTRARVDAVVRRTVVPRQGETRRLTGIVAIGLEREDAEWAIVSMNGTGWP